MANEEIANGKHYKQSFVTEADIGKLADVSWLTEKMKLNGWQARMVCGIAIRESPVVVYRSWLGLSVDPFLIDAKIKPISAVDFSILKKIIRMGRKDGQSVEQDKQDIIGACKSGMMLFPAKTAWYRSVIRAVEKLN